MDTTILNPDAAMDAEEFTREKNGHGAAKTAAGFVAGAAAAKAVEHAGIGRTGSLPLDLFCGGSPERLSPCRFFRLPVGTRKGVVSRFPSACTVKGCGW